MLPPTLLTLNFAMDKTHQVEGPFLGDMEFSTVVNGARLVSCQTGEEPQPFYFQLLNNSTEKDSFFHLFSAVV